MNEDAAKPSFRALLTFNECEYRKMTRKREQARKHAAIYRQKKRDSIQAKKEQIRALEDDVKQIVRRTQEVVGNIRTLVYKPPMSRCAEREMLFDKMAEARTNRDSEGIRQIYIQIKASTDSYIAYQQKSLEVLLSPTVTDQLVVSGFFLEKTRAVTEALKQNVEKIKGVTDLSPAQTEMLDKILQENLKTLSQIYGERERMSSLLGELTSRDALRLSLSFNAEVEVWKHCRDMVTECLLSPLQLADAILGVGIQFPLNELDTALLKHLNYHTTLTPPRLLLPPTVVTGNRQLFH